MKRSFLLCAFAGMFFIGCNSDDDVNEVIPPRDMGEQAVADETAIIAFLQTHFYNEEDFTNPAENFDYVVRFDTIAGDNSHRTPIFDSQLLSTKVYKRNDVEHTIYILKIREGAGAKPTFADSTFMKYNGTLLDRRVFDASTVIPTWFDFPGTVRRDDRGRPFIDRSTIPGFVQAVTEFGEASGFTVNSDNTIQWNNDFGIGAVFMPSGLAYFNNSQGLIPSYSPLVFSFNLLRRVEADHDNDGIPSWKEDLEGDGNLYIDDTDGNGIPNYSDPDDDGDGTPTRREIIIKEDGTIEFPDTNNNGIPNYLDPNYFEPVS